MSFIFSAKAEHITSIERWNSQLTSYLNTQQKKERKREKEREREREREKMELTTNKLLKYTTEEGEKERERERERKDGTHN